MTTCFRRFIALVVSTSFLLESNLVLAGPPTPYNPLEMARSFDQEIKDPAALVPYQDDQACREVQQEFKQCFDTRTANYEYSDGFENLKACFAEKFKEKCKNEKSSAYAETYYEFIRLMSIVYNTKFAQIGQDVFKHLIFDLESEKVILDENFNPADPKAHVSQMPWIANQFPSDQRNIYINYDYDGRAKQEFDFDYFYSQIDSPDVSADLDRTINDQFKPYLADNLFQFMPWRDQRIWWSKYVEHYSEANKSSASEVLDTWLSDLDGSDLIELEQLSQNEEELKKLTEKIFQQNFTLSFPEIYAPVIYKVWWLKEIQKLYRSLRDRKDLSLDWNYLQAPYLLQTAQTKVIPIDEYCMHFPGGCYGRTISEQERTVVWRPSIPGKQYPSSVNGGGEGVNEFFAEFVNRKVDHREYLKKLDNILCDGKVPRATAVPEELKPEDFPLIHLAANHELWPFWKKLYSELKRLEKGKGLAKPTITIPLSQFIRDFGVRSFLGRADLNLNLFMRALLLKIEDSKESDEGQESFENSRKLLENLFGRREITWSENFWEEVFQSNLIKPDQVSLEDLPWWKKLYMRPYRSLFPSKEAKYFLTKDEIRKRLQEQYALQSGKWLEDVSRTGLLIFNQEEVRDGYEDLMKKFHQLVHLPLLTKAEVEAAVQTLDLVQGGIKVKRKSEDENEDKNENKNERGHLSSILEEIWNKWSQENQGSKENQDSAEDKLYAKFDKFFQREYQVRKFLAYWLYTIAVFYKYTAYVEVARFLENLDVSTITNDKETFRKFAIYVFAQAIGMMESEQIMIPPKLQNMMDQTFHGLSGLLEWIELGTIICFLVAPFFGGVTVSLALAGAQFVGAMSLGKHLREELIERPLFRLETNPVFVTDRQGLWIPHATFLDTEEEGKAYMALNSLDQDSREPHFKRLVFEAIFFGNMNVMVAQSIRELGYAPAFYNFLRTEMKMSAKQATQKTMWHSASDDLGSKYFPLILRLSDKGLWRTILTEPAPNVSQMAFEVATKDLKGVKLVQEAAKQSARVIGDNGGTFFQDKLRRMIVTNPKEHVLPFAEYLKKIGMLTDQEFASVKAYADSASFSRWGWLKRLHRLFNRNVKVPTKNEKEEIFNLVVKKIDPLIKEARKGRSSLEDFLRTEQNFELFNEFIGSAVGPWREILYKAVFVGYGDFKFFDRLFPIPKQMAVLGKIIQSYRATRHLQIMFERLPKGMVKDAKSFQQVWQAIHQGQPGELIVKVLKDPQNAWMRSSLLEKGIYNQNSVSGWNLMSQAKREALFEELAFENYGCAKWIGWLFGKGRVDITKANYYL